MSRDPMSSLDVDRRAVELEQLDDAWLDIERALERAEAADLGGEAPPSIAPSAAAAATPRRGRLRRAFRFLAGGR